MTTTRLPSTVSVTFAAAAFGRPGPTACGLCGKETTVTLAPSSDAPPCCRECFRKRRAVVWP